MFEKASAYGLEFLVPTADLAIGASLRDHGEFARPELDFLLAHAETGSGTLLDVGANLGSIALPFAAQRPDWDIVAIEAHGGLCDLLAENANNNGLQNVEAVHAAATCRAGTGTFPSPPLTLRGNHGTLRIDQLSDVTEVVRLLRLDEFCGCGVRLVKIDVEGHEPEVLRGAVGLIRERSAVWVVEANSRSPIGARQLIETFLAAGFTVAWLFAPFATPLSRTSPANAMRGDMNLVAAPMGTSLTWPLTPASDTKMPFDLAAHPYLARYGYCAGAVT